MKKSIVRNSFIQRFVQSVLLLAMIFSFIANADVQLKFIDGKKFTDYEITGQSRSKSLESIERDLKKLFVKLSTGYIDEKQILEIDVTNIDLPGIFHFSYGPQGQDMRVIESNTRFKLYFNYLVKGSDGEIVKKGEYKIKEFSDSSSSFRLNKNRGTVGYYEKPLEKWFKQTFAE